MLVFDLLSEQEYATVVPGGRVEPGETVEETVLAGMSVYGEHGAFLQALVRRRGKNRRA